MKFAFRAKLSIGSKSFVAQHTFLLEIVGADEEALLRERVALAGACCESKLPRRVLRVYWLRYLPRSVFRERVSGASPLVCTGLQPMKPCERRRLLYVRTPDEYTAH